MAVAATTPTHKRRSDAIRTASSKKFKPNPLIGYTASRPSSAAASATLPQTNKIPIELIQLILSYLPPTHHVPVIDFFCEKIPGDHFWTSLFLTYFNLRHVDCIPSLYAQFAANSAKEIWKQKSVTMVSFASLVSRQGPLLFSAPLPQCSKVVTPLKIAACAGSFLEVREAQTGTVLLSGNHEQELQIMADRSTPANAESYLEDFPTTRPVSYLALSPNGTIATGIRDGEIFFWNLSTQKATSTLELSDADPLPGRLTTLEQIAFLADGTLLAAYTADKGFLCRWHPETCERIHKVDVPGRVETFVLNQNGKKAFVLVNKKIPRKEQTDGGNTHTSIFYEYDFFLESNQTIAIPGPLNGVVWKGGFTVLSGNTLVAAIRQDQSPTQLWMFNVNPNESIHLLTLKEKEEITDLQAGRNGLLYIVTNRNEFLVYELIGQKIQLITNYFHKADASYKLLLGISPSTVTVATQNTGCINTFSFPNKVIRSAAAAAPQTDVSQIDLSEE
ncbi:MAG TPA: hypothetical protein VGM34_01450 [Chlamydiales bacterium]|jgi:hypothetical protein